MVNLLELIEFLRCISAYERIQERGGTTKGDLMHGLETDGDKERLKSEMERRRWHITSTLVQTLSPQERGCEYVVHLHE